MKYDQMVFSENLLKGRVAETVFEQMFRGAGCFTILSFGYEKILPELANRKNDVKTEETMEIIRRAPDFAVINNETHDVFLIEVKYLRNPNPGIILQNASKMYASWKPSYLFLATPNGFFFDRAIDIIKKKGDIKEFLHPQIPKEVQLKYTELLNEFISPVKEEEAKSS